MNNIIKIANKEIRKLEKVIKKIDKFLSDAPKGTLKWQHRNNKIYYYHQYSVPKNNKEEDGLERYKRKYIKKQENILAKSLSQKYYYNLVKSIAVKQLDALKQFIEGYPNKDIENIYDELSAERKNLIEPLYVSVQERLRQWNEEKYEQTKMYSENLTFETEQEEVVRSKSEVIIANILYQNRKDILYKYERPLELVVNGNLKTIYPDFTVINKHTGKIIYWEHMGRMDEQCYVEKFVKKINMYVSNGLIPGKDLILTFETQESPLDIAVVKRLIRDMIEDGKMS